MAATDLTKVTYVDGTTVIGATNLNAIQDTVKAHKTEIDALETTLTAAVNGKVGKQTTSGTFAYTHSGSLDGEKAITETPTASAIPMYGSGGVLKAGVPSADNDVVRKLEMDDAVAKIDAMKGVDEVSVTEFDGTVAASGATVAYNNGALEIYGTPTAARYLIYLNGQSVIGVSTTQFQQTLPAGIHTVHINNTGYVPSEYTPYLAWTESTFSTGNVNYVSNGNKIVADVPVMVGFYLKSGISYGTSDNPARFEISITSYQAKTDKTVTDRMSDSIDSIDSRVNSCHGLINYGYDQDANLVSNTESSALYKIGVIRRGTQLKLNLPVADTTYAIRVKISGTVSRAGSTSGVSGWTTGIKLTSGHLYRFKLSFVSGSMTNMTGNGITAQVYKVETNDSLGEMVGNKFVFKAGDSVIREFEATDDNINLCVYVYPGITITNGVFQATLEDATYDETTSVYDAFSTANITDASLATISDGANNVAYKNFLIKSLPPQDGSGDPSPSNVRTINQRTGITLYAYGKNLADSSDFTGVSSGSGSYSNDTITVTGSQAYSAVYIKVKLKAGQTYRFRAYAKITSGKAQLGLRYTGNSVVAAGSARTTDGYISFSYTAQNTGNHQFTMFCNYGTASANSNVTFSEIQCISADFQTTSYEPYNIKSKTVSITYDDNITVYGGTLDLLNGILKVDKMVKTVSEFVADNASFTIYTSGDVTGIRFNIANRKYSTTGIGNSSHYKFRGNFTTGEVPNLLNNEFLYQTTTNMVIIRDDRFTDDTLYPTDADKIAAFQETCADAQFLYEISPVTYYIDPVSIRTLLGKNTVWTYTETDTFDCTYRADPTLYSDKNVTAIKQSIAPIETGETASQAYDQGKYFYLNNDFCKAKTAIASGATFTLGTNYEVTTVAAELFSALS